MALPSMCKLLYGDLSVQEAKKFGLLALMFFNIIGSYWLLRPLKDGIFYTIVGLEYLPYAKMLSFIVIVPLILVYSKLVDLYSKHWLVYIIASSYAALFAIVALLLLSPTVGLANTDASPWRVLGWVTYFGIESYGSIVVALFWSFVASCTSSGSAKKGYALIVTGGQIGSILGPSLATQTATLTIPGLVFVAVMGILTVVLLTNYYMTQVGNAELDSAAKEEAREEAEEQANEAAKYQRLQRKTAADMGEGEGEISADDSGDSLSVSLSSEAKSLSVSGDDDTLESERERADDERDTPVKKTAKRNKKTTPGLLVGLRLLVTQRYLLGIFGISTIYEVVGTIMDYQMKMLAKEVYSSPAAYTSFLASFGVATNTLSFCIALLGTSYLMRTLGLRVCLLIYPCAVGAVLFAVFMFPVLSVVFLAQVSLKGLSYALNNPSKEMLYLPTSPDVKFKVKSWIDMFGGRSAKATGAMIVTPLKQSLERLLYMGSLLALGWVALWLFVAVYVGNQFTILNREHEAEEAERAKAAAK
eukprot:CAMPEP_0114629546 /NCGR_PEP_ID=MMETSP0168-20121206/13418_1 /TAXON_ID=95228 ORGANISM="Vannella sp., Strain DIVA3 517/6/12" /NCGR_SAMPLE_ID=MMETSP0168 /ASSEMBLY_ACC=CAM_ASM_000044 /LENGTH=530 /DNA_ID=CAMNT_0001841015 /DNA_START=235 /DNA_END=1824 /DNA_ORIENTATION=-